VNVIDRSRRNELLDAIRLWLRGSEFTDPGIATIINALRTAHLFRLMGLRATRTDIDMVDAARRAPCLDEASRSVLLTAHNMANARLAV